MELILTQQPDYQVEVICDDQYSHAFDVQPLRLLAHWYERVSRDPMGYGQRLFHALFPTNSRASNALNAHPERIVLVTTDDELDALPWEYLYSPTGFLVLEFPFVRALPSQQRRSPPTLDTPLHIVAVPSHPLSPLIAPLNIDAEWWRLKEIVDPLPFAITLERVRPPTLQQVRSLLANRHQRVIHFMGHGEHAENGAFLSFEKENGSLDRVETRQLISRIRGTTFLITLNACVSASPGPTGFSNLAASLVKANIPYALGMRFNIYDEDALAFSRMFYTELAQGTPVEEALLQARLSLAESPRSWAVGVPALYTSLSTPAHGFIHSPGSSRIIEHQPRIEANSVARAVGIFQGRTADLTRLGSLLTGNNRPRILTIHGGGGQGKTALAREAIERFAHAWPGGVWGTILNPLPTRPGFVSNLAQFLGSNEQEIHTPEEREYQVLRQLTTKRLLLVLDNAETLIDAVDAHDPQAIALAELLQQLPGTSVSLLITSRIQLGWPGEVTHELGGLTAEEGALLFRQCAPGRQELIDTIEAQKLSEKIEGHPLSLRLLGGAFNASTLLLHTFVQHYEEQLLNAENKYIGEEHRHRKLYASIETSIRFLNNELCDLLSNLPIFQSPFLPALACSLFDPETEGQDPLRSPVHAQLVSLWQRGLLARITVAGLDGTQNHLYYLLPTTRPYIQAHMQSTMPLEELFHRYGKTYEAFTNNMYALLDYNPHLVAIVQYMEKDLEQGIEHVANPEQQTYRAHWAWMLFRLGRLRDAQTLLEDVLERIQGQDHLLELQVTDSLGHVYQTRGQPQQALTLFEHFLSTVRGMELRSSEGTALYNMGKVYLVTGQMQRALELFEQALPILREVGDLTSEGGALSNMAAIYQATGQPQRALELFEEALPLIRASARRPDEAATLSNIGGVYRATGQLQRALELFEEALAIQRDIGDRMGEAVSLSNIASISQANGQPQRALDLLEQTLSIQRQAGNRAGEATTLHNIGMAHQGLDQPQRALSFYEQALSVRRETGDRTGEAATLSIIASLYGALGQPQRALDLFEQALPLRRETGDRAGEAFTLHNMAGVYQDLGQSQRALSFYEQALSIRREIHNRADEAMTLHNIALIYQDLDQPQRALDLFKQALSLLREVGDHVGEATTLGAMATIYRDLDQPQHALELFEQVLLLGRTTDDRASEFGILIHMAEIYHTTGQLQRALDLFEQALFISQELDDRAGDAILLNHMAEIYRTLSQPQRALDLFEQVLSIQRETRNRADEAATLNKLGQAYQDLGQLQRALSFYEEALLISHEVHDRVGEARVLNNLGLVSRILGQPQRALSFYEQALPLLREINNNAIEGITLSNMGSAYLFTGQRQRALTCFEQALPLLREVGDRVGEMTTLNNAAMIYQDFGQSQKALSLFEQARPIAHEIGHQADEASILHNIVRAYHTLGQSQRALPLLEQALSIFRDLGDHASEAATLNSMVFLLYGDLKRPTEALRLLQQVRGIFERYGLQQDAAGNTREMLDAWQKKIQQESPPGPAQADQMTLSPDRLQQMIINTIAVMTKTPERRIQWSQRIEAFLQEAQAHGNDQEAELYASMLHILNHQAPTLAPDHPYAPAIQAIQKGIAQRKASQ
ncbi:tetratricopeptide repeat protein [Ktedonospora formicarum]|uniref:CHAT domain-containing protein n=1 Tax=Ktedonospora formicarum TaxID=2778364 RepID=A0A8J3I2I0_9CHLR|nr:tetratricopeptide repeat protein [Ktedonospora formicarum]GHO47571.1 hypothetical protein KSX_57340 [Ktedonospora formicarum]